MRKKFNKLSIFNFQFSTCKGFTLIELLVVIAIIGILTGFLTSNYISMPQRGRDAQRKSDLRQLQNGFEMRRADDGRYFTDTEFNTVNCPDPNPHSLDYNSVTYMSKMPCDPLTKLKYSYRAEPNVPTPCDNIATNCTGYSLSVCLENSNDKDPQTVDDAVGCPASKKKFVVTNP